MPNTKLLSQTLEEGGDRAEKIAHYLLQNPFDLVDARRLMRRFQASGVEIQQALSRLDRLEAEGQAAKRLAALGESESLSEKIVLHLRRHPCDLVDTRRLMRRFGASGADVQRALAWISQRVVEGGEVEGGRALTRSEVAIDLREPLSYAPAMSEFLALVELGSNAVRCLVVSIIPGVGFQVLREEREQTRLSGGSPGVLPPAAVRETVRVVQRFLREARREYRPRILAVATSAVRDATNRRALLERLRREVGVTIQVLSGEEEARLGAQAVLSSLSLRNGVVADLGGGSLQLTQIRGGTITSAASFPLGAVRTTARFFKNDPPTKQEIQALRQEIQRHCERDLPSLYKGEEIIGLGGTVRTLARMHLAVLDKQRSRQGLCLRRSDVSALRERIEGLAVRDRTRLRGLKEERADIIFAGAIVIEEVMRLGGYRMLTVCTGGVRQGLLLREAFG